MTRPSLIGIGITGSGAMGRAYAECVTRHASGARLIAVAGGTRAETLGRDYAIAAEPAIEDLIARRDIDAVMIASPDSVHGAQTVLAAAAGKHVLVEKPMAPTIAQCDEMIAAADAAGVRLMVVKHWRFREVHTRARALLASGEFGGIRRIENHTHAALSSSLELVKRKPFYTESTGGGLLMGWAVHNLDFVCWLAGAKPQSLRALSAPRLHERLGPVHLDVELAFPGAFAARVTVTIDRPANPAASDVFRTRIVTERAVLDLDGYGELRVDRGAGWRTEWRQPPFNPANPTDPRRLEAYAAMVQAFIASVRTDAPIPVSGADGRRAVELFHAACGAAP